MPAAARSKLDSGTPRRSPRLKQIHMIYDEDSESDSSAFKRVKTEVIDLEETASPSTSELSISSVNDKDDEQDIQNVSLKDLRAQCKAKNRKASKITSEVYGTKDQTGQVKEEFDLDEPLIALKQKKHKTSPTKANKVDGAASSPCPGEVEDTTKGHKTPSPQSSPLKATMHNPAMEKLETEVTYLELSQIATDCTEEIVGEQICCGEVEDTVGALVSCGNPDVICEVKTEDIDCSEEIGTSSCCEKDSSYELQQQPVESGGCMAQSCFMNQPTKLAGVSDCSLEQTCSVKEHSFDDIAAATATETVSLLDFVNEVSNHQKTLDNISSSDLDKISNSDLDKSSVGNELSVCSINQSCEDLIDNNEYWNTGVVQENETESVKILEELSPIGESSTDMVSPLLTIQSDLCGSKEMNCTPLEEFEQMQAEGQLGSIVCCGVRPTRMLVNMEIEHAFAFDNTPDLTQPVNFAVQDGRLESIVCDALNNHAQKLSSESKSSIELPDAAVIQTPPKYLTNNFSDNQKVSDDGKISLLDNVDLSLKSMNQLSHTIDNSICISVNNERAEEELVLQPQLFQASADKFNTRDVTSEISYNEETQELSAGAPILSATSSLETDGRIKKAELFIDEESIEEHGPRKLLSKRKIISPTSQEKLCNALTGIDLCDGVQRLKRKIILEDCDKSKQDKSLFGTDRRLKGRTFVRPTSKGVLKTTESPSHQHTCSCMRSSPVILDTEKAVEFSQRQMHDMENIAAKLIRTLKHMKSIVDESLSSEAYSLLPNFNLAEIRAASEDALEVEKTTRRWLTIMNKDCNRFCKILTLARKNAVSHPEPPRKQRKITFADEAGGKLCHVKVFKDGQTCLLSECQSDKCTNN